MRIYKQDMTIFAEQPPNGLRVLSDSNSPSRTFIRANGLFTCPSFKCWFVDFSAPNNPAVSTHPMTLTVLPNGRKTFSHLLIPGPWQVRFVPFLVLFWCKIWERRNSSNIWSSLRHSKQLHCWCELKDLQGWILQTGTFLAPSLHFGVFSSAIHFRQDENVLFVCWHSMTIGYNVPKLSFTSSQEEVIQLIGSGMTAELSSLQYNGTYCSAR